MKGLYGRQRWLQDEVLPAINVLDKYDDYNSENVLEFCIDAGSTGNIARFINHSCEPNLFVRCVLSAHGGFKVARVILIASDNLCSSVTHFLLYCSSGSIQVLKGMERFFAGTHV